jgi:putative addiction module component (TIGR02574 family)
MSVDQLKEQLLALPIHDRADLASFLLATLDENSEDPAVVDAAWKEEIQRRTEEMDSGKVQTVPAEEVFAALRKKSS